jgi:hypothetical protein
MKWFIIIIFIAGYGFKGNEKEVWTFIKEKIQEIQTNLNDSDVEEKEIPDHE